MNHLSFPEFLSRREAFDAAVGAQDEIAKFCSSSSWMCAANGLLHASEGETEERDGKEAREAARQVRQAGRAVGIIERKLHTLGG